MAFEKSLSWTLTRILKITSHMSGAPFMRETGVPGELARWGGERMGGVIRTKCEPLLPSTRLSFRPKRSEVEESASTQFVARTEPVTSKPTNRCHPERSGSHREPRSRRDLRLLLSSISRKPNWRNPTAPQKRRGEVPFGISPLTFRFFEDPVRRPDHKRLLSRICPVPASLAACVPHHPSS
jgi:hypothetical protein